MNDFQQRVASRFNRAAATYDAHASAQRHAAARLAGLIATIGLPPRPQVLELGCGTGHFTGLLVRHLPGARILATDIAPAMVAACRNRLANQGSIRFAVMDGCRPASADCCDLICANLAAQWFQNLPAVLAQWAARLTPAGTLALSLLGQDTFCEWRDAHTRCGLQAGTLPFYTSEQFARAFPSGGRLQMTTETWIERHVSGLDFLRGLRAIGADTASPNHQPLTTAGLRRVLRELSFTPTTSYQLLHACWQRD